MGLVDFAELQPSTRSVNGRSPSGVASFVIGRSAALWRRPTTALAVLPAAGCSGQPRSPIRTPRINGHKPAHGVSEPQVQNAYENKETGHGDSFSMVFVTQSADLADGDSVGTFM